MSEPSPERHLHGSVARTPVRGRREVGLVAGATTDVSYFRLAPESQIPPVCYFRQLRNRLTRLRVREGSGRPAVRSTPRASISHMLAGLCDYLALATFLLGFVFLARFVVAN